MWRAFRSRNFRLFFAGQSVSLVGTWIQNIAMSWLVYRLTHSAFMLGVVAFASQVPIFLGAPFAGVFVDKWPRHRILVITQTLAMVQAFILAVLTAIGVVMAWQVIVLGICLGLVSALDMPTRQTFLIDLVERKEDLGNAIAFNSFMFNAARLVGPSIAGIFIALWGEGVCFFVNGISYGAVLLALCAIKVPQKQMRPHNLPVLEELREGLRYAFGFVPIRAILLLLGLVSLMGMSYAILMPVFARDILHGGPKTLGFLMAASGLGALLGAVYLVARKRMVRIGRIIPTSCIVFAGGLIAFSVSRVVWFSLAALFVAGFGAMIQMTSSNTILQTIVDDDKRGRVMSFFTMSFIGMSTFGSLLAGALASTIGARYAILAGGATCIVGALVFAQKIRALKTLVHPIYEKMKLVGEAPSPLQT